MNPAFVLGIDGLPFTLTHQLINEGVIPNFKNLLSGSGQLNQLHVTVPDFSCVSWTSFATGVNPGKHGIYGFNDFHPLTGEFHFPNASDCRATQLWHAVGEAGGRSIVINLPGTYPATPLKGQMVSGFVSPEFDKACYPLQFAKLLKKLDYKMELDGKIGLGSAKRVRELIKSVFQARKRTIKHVIQHEQWDLLIAVITETDRLQHYYLPAIDDPANPHHAWVIQFYRELDSFIGEVVELLPPEVPLYMVSDHGFATVRQTFVLYELLAELGLSPGNSQQFSSQEEALKHTKVFALDPARFYINRKNSRFKHGFVEENEALEIIHKIKEKLLTLRDPQTNELVVNTVRTREEGFWGDASEYAPDLVAATRPGYYFTAIRKPQGKQQPGVWDGNHVWNDAIVYTPFQLTEDNQPMIWDVMPTVLANMGVEVPEFVDGRVLK
jgi:predicted AlkP superfamily phosphohydrolase/phosphomutase